MGVYIYQSGTEKELKNAYIGEVYEYSYDFRNKSTSQLQTDGWTISTGTPAFNGSGMYQSNTNDVRIIKPIDLSNANKIIVSYTGTYPSVGATYIGLLDGNNWTTIEFDSRLGQTSFYVGPNKIITGPSVSSGTRTVSCTMDLIKKTATLSITGKSDTTWTLTDTDVTNVRANTDCMLHIWGGWGEKVYIQDYNITVY